MRASTALRSLRAQGCFYLTRTVQAACFRILLASAFRVLLACGFRFTNDFSHVLHWDEDQCFDVAAIAGAPMLPRLIAVASAAAARRFVGIIVTS